MSKCKNKKMFAVWLFAICAVVICGSFAGSAEAKVDYVLMVQQTPVDGGSVTPDIGVHSVSANGDVKVTATPRQGYQFVYWLGDVSDPTANSTIVAVNSPKIVVAVFERSEYELPFATPAAGESGGGGGGGLLVPNRQAIGGGGDISPASGSVNANRNGSTFISPTDNPIPVPSGDIPEPATMLLLGIGSLLALNKKK